MGAKHMRAATALKADRQVIEEIAAVDRRLVRDFGERCDTFEVGCATCQCWRARDILHRAFEIAEDI